MKQVALCLTLAILCGVALSYSCEDWRKALYEAYNVRGMMTNTYTVKAGWNGLDQHIAKIEVELNICENRTKPEMRACEEAKRSAEKFRSTVMIQIFRGKHYKERDEADNEFLRDAIRNLAKFRAEVGQKCPAVEVCNEAKGDVKSRFSSLMGFRSYKEYDPMQVLEAESDLEVYKNIVVARCPVNDVCAYAQEELNRSTDVISYELTHSPRSQKEIEKHSLNYRNASDLLIKTCSVNEVCSHVEQELKSAEESLKVMIRSTSPNVNVIAEFESRIEKLKAVHNNKCVSHGAATRLAEITNRFLSKLLKH